MIHNYYFKKVVLITGGASGLGAAIAENLIYTGAHVIVLDNDNDKLDSFIVNNKSVKGYHADVSDINSLKYALSKINEEFKQIDILINNAGVFISGEARDFNTGQWRKCFDVNLLGMVNMISIIYPEMVNRKSGQIINIASMVGLAPLPLIIPYVASKYGIVGLTRSLRIEAGSLGVKINLVCPGRLDTLLLEKSEMVNSKREEFLSNIPFKPYPLNKAVRKILYGSMKNKPMIIFPWYVYWLWYTERFSKWLLFPFYAFALKKFRKIRLPG